MRIRVRKGRHALRIILIATASVFLTMFFWKAAPIEILSSAHFHGSTENQAIALSFDDGPDWGEEVLLSALNQAEIRATFFWTWEKVEMLNSEDPQRFARILELLREGDHEVGIHGHKCTVSSNLLRRILGLAEVEDLTMVKRYFSGLLHQTPTLYRPHGVQLGRELINAINASGLQLVVGSPSYQIGQGNPPRSYLQAFRRAKPGDIICGHDSKDCYPDFGLAQQITQLIPEMEEILANRGISVVTVSEIISPDVLAQD
jgi:peptidoglycan/xylan/chitin deacetylase (PgdA/CDA1 family)